MSDILALPLVVLNNEHQAFWCFDYTMKMMVSQLLQFLKLFFDFGLFSAARESLF